MKSHGNLAGYKYQAFPCRQHLLCTARKGVFLPYRKFLFEYPCRTSFGSVGVGDCRLAPSGGSAPQERLGQ